MGTVYHQATNRISQTADKQMSKTIFNQTTEIYTLLRYQIFHHINNEFLKYSVLTCIQRNRF